MYISHATRRPLQTALFALTALAAFGCDAARSEKEERLENLGAAPEPASAERPAAALEASDDAEVDSFETARPFDDDSDAVATGGCVLLRPAGWSGGGTSCAEYYLRSGSPPGTLSMTNGQSFFTSARYTSPSGGHGEALISCNNGSITIQALSCGAGAEP